MAQLFDRYSADLYDYMSRLVGDRDQAARLLDTVFMRVPGAAPGFQARDSVRGGLYSIARETGLDWLRQRGWLDGLPPSDEAIQPGLQGDVWKAARAMPAFFRAVLITEELQPLSPTEKSRALGVNRTDLARLIEEARRSFNRIYDAQARAEGRPTSDRINTDTVWNARRRLPVEGGSLFGFLPPIEFPDSLKQQIRRHVIEAAAPPVPRPVAGEPVSDEAFAAAATAAAAAAAARLNAQTPPAATPPQAPPPQAPPPQVAPPVIPPPQPQLLPSREYNPPVNRMPIENQNRFGGLSTTTALAALIGVALALLICGVVFLLTQNRSQITFTSLQPSDGSTIQQAPEINVFAVYQSDNEIDTTKSGMQIDGHPVVPQFVSSSIAWTGPLAAGPHTVSVALLDKNGKSAAQTWSFTIGAQGTLVPPPTAVVPTSSLSTVTPIVPITAEVPSVTPIIFPGTSTPVFPPTSVFPTFVPPTSPSCNVGGVAGYVFNDLNGNGVREPNEPIFPNVGINLLTFGNAQYASALSDAFGNYLFSNVPFGQYRVQAVTPVGWTVTTTPIYNVNLFGCNTVSGFNFGFQQSAQTSTPTPTATTGTSFAVTAVNASVSPTFSGSCTQTFTFTGTITTNGPGTVWYQWHRYDGSLTPQQPLIFGSASTLAVAPDTFTITAPAGTLVGWAKIDVILPNATSSVPAFFTINCVGSPTPTATATVTPIVFTVTPTFTPTVTPTSTATTVVTPTFTPTPTTVPFVVVSANATVTPPASTTCPQNYDFSGDITVTGTGTVNYQWLGSDSLGGTYTGPMTTLTFLAPGTQPLTIPFQIPYSGPGPLNLTGEAHIHVTSPNVFDSANANYTLNCP